VISPEYYSANIAASAKLAGAAISNLMFDSQHPAAFQYVSSN
jgi:hypothetical protein